MSRKRVLHGPLQNLMSGMTVLDSGSKIDSFSGWLTFFNLERNLSVIRILPQVAVQNARGIWRSAATFGRCWNMLAHWSDSVTINGFDSPGTSVGSRQCNAVLSTWVYRQPKQFYEIEVGGLMFFNSNFKTDRQYVSHRGGSNYTGRIIFVGFLFLVLCWSSTFVWYLANRLKCLDPIQ